MRPQMPKFSAGDGAFEAYRRDFEAWMKSPEGVAEIEREKAEALRRHTADSEAFDRNRTVVAGKLLDATDMPSRALAAVLAGKLEMTEAMGAADDARDLLVLSGGPGCGKTVAATAWVVGFVRDPANWQSESDPRVARFRFRHPVWVTAAKLARWERYDEDKMSELLKTPRLVIDDLGGEYMDKGGFYASLLDEIVNERQASSRPTIFTTNLNAEAFKARYGERIVDRIREGGRFVECGNKSLRTRAS